MALEKMTDEVSVHQTLGDEPNADDGMTGDDLKRLFDRPAELLKAFINEKLVPNAVDKTGDAMSGNLSIPSPKLAEHAATKGYVDGKIHFSSTEPTDWKDGDIWLMPVEE